MSRNGRYVHSDSGGRRLECLVPGATPPSRNGLSHANRERNASMAEALFWAVLEHLRTVRPDFGGSRARGLSRRFRRKISIVDSTTIQLVASGRIEGDMSRQLTK